jgi:DNA-binding XRE family transcriptional regulator
MDADKKARLEAAGYRVGTVAEFLGLTPEDEAVIEQRLAAEKARLALAKLVKESRGSMTQAELAKRIKTSQPRVAKIEAGEPNVSIDLLVRAAIGAGADLKRIGQVLIQAGS